MLYFIKVDASNTAERKGKSVKLQHRDKIHKQKVKSAKLLCDMNRLVLSKLA